MNIYIPSISSSNAAFTVLLNLNFLKVTNTDKIAECSFNIVEPNIYEIFF